jgi:hypothetical protein
MSGDYVLLKPGKNSNNLLKIKRTELFELLNAGLKEYFNDYTSNFALCIDSIPLISKRLFMHYNSQLFEYSKRPDVKLYLTDSLNKVLTMEEKTFLSMDQYMAFISTDPEDPSVGHDTIILADYNMKDTAKEQAIFFMITIKDFRIILQTISCGLQRTSVGFMPFIVPYGYLPFAENMVYTPAELNRLNSILRIKMSDDLSIYKTNEEMYDDYFGGDD